MPLFSRQRWDVASRDDRLLARGRLLSWEGFTSVSPRVPWARRVKSLGGRCPALGVLCLCGSLRWDSLGKGQLPAVLPEERQVPCPQSFFHCGDTLSVPS